jgi:hypothetical protein
VTPSLEDGVDVGNPRAVMRRALRFAACAAGNSPSSPLDDGVCVPGPRLAASPAIVTPQALTVSSLLERVHACGADGESVRRWVESALPAEVPVVAPTAGSTVNGTSAAGTSTASRPRAGDAGDGGASGRVAVAAARATRGGSDVDDMERGLDDVMAYVNAALSADALVAGDDDGARSAVRAVTVAGGALPHASRATSAPSRGSGDRSASRPRRWTFLDADVTPHHGSADGAAAVAAASPDHVFDIHGTLPPLQALVKTRADGGGPPMHSTAVDSCA